MARRPRQLHDLQGGPRLTLDGPKRVFSVHCRCGWRSEPCSTPILAEAAGEQHVLLAGRLRPIVDS